MILWLNSVRAGDSVDISLVVARWMLKFSSVYIQGIKMKGKDECQLHLSLFLVGRKWLPASVSDWGQSADGCPYLEWRLKEKHERWEGKINLEVTLGWPISHVSHNGQLCLRGPDGPSMKISLGLISRGNSSFPTHVCFSHLASSDHCSTLVCKTNTKKI